MPVLGGNFQWTVERSPRSAPYGFLMGQSISSQFKGLPKPFEMSMKQRYKAHWEGRFAYMGSCWGWTSVALVVRTIWCFRVWAIFLERVREEPGCGTELTSTIIRWTALSGHAIMCTFLNECGSTVTQGLLCQLHFCVFVLLFFFYSFYNLWCILRGHKQPLG